MENRLADCLSGRAENYLLPFFWQHGEDDETLCREIDAIEASGIKALCVESRPHEDFCGETWWHTMDLILERCARKQMKVWLLDDKHFPSGYANGIISKSYPERRMWSITERHMDISGPMKDAALMTDWKQAESDVLLGIVAWKIAPDTGRLTGAPIELTAAQYDGMVAFDVPEGWYRVFYLLKTHTGYSANFADYTDKLTPEGGDAFLEAVYEPHYARYSRYFGNTFAGFFSDEPCFGNNSARDFRAAFGVKYSFFPYSDEVMALLQKQFGAEALSMLPALWFPADTPVMQRIRLAYMDCVTQLYKKNFCCRLGDWCRSHGVEYIGHTIEDDHQHIGTQNSSGHYFRGLDGQDMAGIDVVLCQVVPGMTDYANTAPLSYDIADPDFFHFMLPKLGPSHAHIQPAKKGRAMCEIYGAYGWAEGLKMMKWLTDLMLVRGNNRFVPHAFSPKFPDGDCPPHFYAGGTNPQFRDFRLLAAYTNRVCHLLADRIPTETAAVLYYAEAAWSGGAFMRTDTVVRLLTEQTMSCDIVPFDYLETAATVNRCLHVGNAAYPCLIIPESEFLPRKGMECILRLAAAGLPVFVLNRLPRIAEAPEEGYDSSVLQLTTTQELPHRLGTLKLREVAPDRPQRFLRYLRTNTADKDTYFVTNEDAHSAIDCRCRFAGFAGGCYLRYDPMENRAFRCYSTDGAVPVRLPAYCSSFYLFGYAAADLPEEFVPQKEDTLAPELHWSIELAPAAQDLRYSPFRTETGLFNITGREGLPRFSGHMRYTTHLNCPEISPGSRLVLDLGYAGETASVTVNGQKIGTKITPPYCFDISGFAGENAAELIVEVTNHYGYALRDFFSKYLAFEPSGLLGPVRLHIRR